MNIPAAAGCLTPALLRDGGPGVVMHSDRLSSFIALKARFPYNFTYTGFKGGCQ